MHTIYKYPLKVGTDDVYLIEMPHLSRFVDIQYLGGECYLWAEVDTNKRPNGMTATIIFVVTGEPMDHLYETFGDLVHLKTIQKGPYIGHFFTPRQSNGLRLK